MMSPSLLIFQTLKPYFQYKKPGFFLFGHGVIEKKKINTLIQDLHIDLSHLGDMIDMWRQMGFVFITMEEALDVVINGYIINKPWIHLTFDDGYRNNYTLLYPFLKARKIPFTIFLSTYNITENKRFDNYKIYCSLIHTRDFKAIEDIFEEFAIVPPTNVTPELFAKDVMKIYKYFAVPEKLKFMTRVQSLLTTDEWRYYDKLYDSEEVMVAEEVREMAEDPLVSFGSHGHNHYILSTLDDEGINYEQRQSKKLMKRLTGRDPATYCYPNGKLKDIPTNIGSLTEGNDYTAAFTTVKRKISGRVSPYAIPRFPLSYRYLPKLFLRVL